MKITVTMTDEQVPRKASLPFPTAEHVSVQYTCPHCGETPLLVVGKAGTGDQTDRDMVRTAVCKVCSKKIGTIRVEFDTLFGQREDERVLAGPYKVF